MLDFYTANMGLLCAGMAGHC